MLNRLLITFTILTFGYYSVFCLNIERTANIQPYKDSFEVKQFLGFSLQDRLEIIYHAEEARILAPTNLTAIASYVQGKIYHDMTSSESIYCFVAIGPLQARFAYKEKYIYLKSDTSDNMHILCSSVEYGNSYIDI